MALDEITRVMVDSFLTTSIANNRKIAADGAVAGRRLMGLSPADFGRLADELEAIRNDWRVRRRDSELS